ncbi:CRISPR-associated helicase Cas3' [Rothia halotolerans]|uniref:CRISPR-associated helicase Cas3' n=1 Tax=Rothia halotolerans TaxID=405770 RepID=UPI0013EC9FAC|nr:CRISPR-associated helicase Cas3' [Rothia halotolerans]
MKRTHEALWAKQHGLEEPYPLLAHLLDTAVVARQLYRHWLRPGLRGLLEEGLGENAERLVAWVAGGHDVGKASPVFQWQPHAHGPEWDRIRARLLEAGDYTFDPVKGLQGRAQIEGASRHEQVTAKALHPGVFSSAEEAEDLWKVLPAMGHHGRFVVPFLYGAGATLKEKKIEQMHEKGGWVTAQRDLLGILRESLGLEEADLPESAPNAVTILLSGLTVLADRIASGTDWVMEAQGLMASGELSLQEPGAWLTSREESALRRIRQTVGIYSGWEDEEEAKRAILGEFEPRPLQEEALKAGRGLWNVMVQTGGGKTEAAALRHSTAEERLIFLLPTQATSNALMRRIQGFFRDNPNVAALAHGLASTEDFYSTPVTVVQDGEGEPDNGGLYPAEFVRSGSSRLLAPVCVGTVDQALMGSLPAKWTHLRLLALANAHVVLDEAHTMDQYQSQLLLPLLRWWGTTGTRVSLLTATLPAWQRRMFVEAYTQETVSAAPCFPSVENFASESPSRERTDLPAREHAISWEMSEAPADELVDSHIEWVRNMREQWPEARIGVICNTVARAQGVAETLAHEEEDVVLLHSRMTAEHRRRNATMLEERIGSGRRGRALTVVGTQAIEASLDIDLDLLSTELSPAPSLIQRAGRVWRREDPERKLRIPGAQGMSIRLLRIADADEYKAKPYFRAELDRTWEWLSATRTLRVPQDCQDFIDGSAVTFENILDPTEADLEKYADDALRSQKGRISAHDMGWILDPWCDLGTFTSLTRAEKDVSEEAVERRTRLIDQELRQVILCGDPAVVPGAWPGTVEELKRLKGRDQEKIRQALRSSVALPASHREIYARLEPLRDAESVLSRYWVLETAETHYDPVFGLRKNA